MRRNSRNIFLLLFLITFYGCNAPKEVTTRYTNPVINADAPDPSLARHDGDFYLITTTMHLMPGAPVMKSKDLVNWEIVSYTQRGSR